LALEKVMNFLFVIAGVWLALWLFEQVVVLWMTGRVSEREGGREGGGMAGEEMEGGKEGREGLGKVQKKMKWFF